MNLQVENDYVLHRRFDRIGRLLGDERMERLFRAHVFASPTPTGSCTRRLDSLAKRKPQ